MFKPAGDGVDHINSYSRSRCEIGRMLSNFYRVDIDTPYGVFPSVECFWSYLKTRDERLFHITDPVEARRIGQNGTAFVDAGTFRSLIYDGITYKLDTLSSVILADPLFTDITIPIIHKWVSDGKYTDTGSMRSVRMLLDPIEEWRMRKLCLNL